MHPALDLQSELLSRLILHPPLIAMLGRAAVYDDVPHDSKPPYITFAETEHIDWNTGTEEGLEHFVALDVWSDADGRKEALTLAQEVQTALSGFSGALQENQLVNFSHESTEVRRDTKAKLFRARLAFRAVTEPF